MGGVTAEHCGFRVDDHNRTTDSSGRQTARFSSPVQVQTGDSQSSLATVGEISQVLVSPDGNPNRDIAIFALRGHSIEEAQSAFNSVWVGPGGLSKGDPVYSSGFPMPKPSDPAQVQRREFAMNAIGLQTWNFFTGVLNVLVEGSPVAPDGRTPGPGESGAASISIGPDGKPKIVGIQSEWATDPAAFDQIQAAFGVSFTPREYSAAAGFSFEPPTPTDGTVIDVSPQ